MVRRPWHCAGVIASAMCVTLSCGTPPASTPGGSGRTKVSAATPLGVVTEFPAMTQTPPARQLDIVGRHLVLQGYASWSSAPPIPPLEGWSFDLKTGALVATFAPIGLLNMERTRQGPGVFLKPAGDVLVGMIGGGLFAIDPATGKQRWRTELYDPAAIARMQPIAWEHNRVWPALVDAHKGTIFVLTQEAHARPAGQLGLDENIELFALDAASGAIRWRAPLAGFDVLHEPELGLFVTDDAVVVRRGRELHAFVDGRRVWTAEGGDVVHGDRTTLVAVAQKTITSIDPKTGKRGPKQPDAVGYDKDTALDGGVLYGWAHSADGVKLVATRATDGSRLWETSLVHAMWTNGSPPVPAGAVILTTVGGPVRAFDRATGKTIFVRDIGGAFISRVIDPAQPMLFATFGPYAKPAILAPVAMPALPRVRVSGTVKLECIPQPNTRVWLDDTPVTTDAAGRFDATIDSRGVVSIDTSVQGEMVADDGTIFPSSAGGIETATPDATNTVRMDRDLHMRTNCGNDFVPIPCRPVRTECKR